MIMKLIKQKIQEERIKAIRQFADKACSKFAGHSNYSGDTVLCTLQALSEGRKVKDAVPLDLEALGWRKVRKTNAKLVIKPETHECKLVYKCCGAVIPPELEYHAFCPNCGANAGGKVQVIDDE